MRNKLNTYSNKRQTQTSFELLSDIVNHTTAPLTALQEKSIWENKVFWGLFVVGTATLAATYINPRLILEAAKEIYKLRCTVFFFYGSIDLAACILDKIGNNSLPLFQKQYDYNLITSTINWVGLSAAVSIYFVNKVLQITTIIPFFNIFINAFYVLSEACNTVFDYKQDTRLIKAMKKTEGKKENKKFSLNYLYQRRAINLGMNSLKTLTYVGYTLIPLLLCTTPYTATMMSVAALIWVGLFCIQKGIQIYAARRCHQNKLFSRQQEPGIELQRFENTQHPLLPQNFK